MAGGLHAQNLRRYIGQSFPSGLIVNVLPGPDNDIAVAARMAGMIVRPLDVAEWPFNGLVSLWASGGAPPRALPVGQAEIDFHNQIRDDFARGMNVNGAAITEVQVTALGSRIRAIADIVGRGPDRPGDAAQVMIEVKTGQFADLRINQQYIYALALVGGHLQSLDSRLPKVGLIAGVPLPPMDFLLITMDKPGGKPGFALVRTSSVDRLASMEQLMLLLKALEF